MSILDNFDFDELVGSECDFYGVDGQRFRLDDVTYEVIDHDDDSFDVIVSEKSMEGMPIARVVVDYPCFSRDDTFELTDLHDGHCWLSFGIDHGYPESPWLAFIFDYFPKGPAD